MLSIISKILAFGRGEKRTSSEEFEAAVNAALLSDTVHDVATGRPYVSEEGALNLSAVWACVRILSETVGTLPIHLYRRTSAGREQVREHPCSFILSRPNAYTSRFALLHHLMVSCTLWGNGYARIWRDERFRPVRLQLLHPTQVEPVLSTDDELYYRTDRGELLPSYDMLPTIGSSIGYTYFGNIKMNGYADAGGGTMVPYSEEFREGMGTAMLSISIPVFHWGEGRKKVRKARYELENAQLELEKNRKLLSLEAEQAANNLEESVFMIETAIAGVKHADENLRVTRNRYCAAMATLAELLDSQSQWQQAKSNLIEAKTQYKIYEVQYLRATGALE